MSRVSRRRGKAANASGKTEVRRRYVHRIAVVRYGLSYVNATRTQPVPFTSPGDSRGIKLKLGRVL